MWHIFVWIQNVKIWTEWLPVCKHNFEMQKKFNFFYLNFTIVCLRSNKQVIIVSGNDLLSNRQHAITWTNVDLRYLTPYGLTRPQWVKLIPTVNNETCGPYKVMLGLFSSLYWYPVWPVIMQGTSIKSKMALNKSHLFSLSFDWISSAGTPSSKMLHRLG